MGVFIGRYAQHRLGSSALCDRVDGVCRGENGGSGLLCAGELAYSSDLKRARGFGDFGFESFIDRSDGVSWAGLGDFRRRYRECPVFAFRGSQTACGGGGDVLLQSLARSFAQNLCVALIMGCVAWVTYRLLNAGLPRVSFQRISRKNRRYLGAHHKAFLGDR